MSDEPAHRAFRILTRTRGGWNGSTLYDVQLQSIASGQLVWARTFADHDEAARFRRAVHDELTSLDERVFRDRYRILSPA